jgi:ribosomal protein L40E
MEENNKRRLFAQPNKTNDPNMEKQEVFKPATGSTKLCPHCKAEIPASAKKCSHCGSDLRAWPNRHPIFVTLLVILVIIIFLGILGSNNQQIQSGTDLSSSNGNSQSQPTICDTDLQTLKKQAQAIDYKQLAKDPDSFTGTVTTFTGQILQIQQSGNDGIMRLAVTKASYGWDVNDIIYITYHQSTPAVEDDVVTVTGKLTGSKTYTSTANFQITVPSMDVCSVETQSAQTAPPTTSSTKKSVSAPSAQATNAPAATQAATAPTPTAQPKTWHTAYTYNGNTTIQTPPFSMQGSQWRITYSCSIADSSQSVSWFNGLIDSTNGSGGSAFATTVNCPTNNTSYVYSQDPGQYYLDLSMWNSNYTVTVEDYY